MSVKLKWGAKEGGNLKWGHGPPWTLFGAATGDRAALWV